MGQSAKPDGERGSYICTSFSLARFLLILARRTTRWSDTDTSWINEEKASKRSVLFLAELRACFRIASSLPWRLLLLFFSFPTFCFSPLNPKSCREHVRNKERTYVRCVYKAIWATQYEAWGKYPDFFIASHLFLYFTDKSFFSLFFRIAIWNKRKVIITKAAKKTFKKKRLDFAESRVKPLVE